MREVPVVGALLHQSVTSAKAESRDATTIKGFDPQALDVEVALKEKCQKSVVIVALGYRSAEDCCRSRGWRRKGYYHPLTTNLAIGAMESREHLFNESSSN